MEFVIACVACVASFALGHWTGVHPDDARSFAQRVKAKISGWFQH